MWSDLTLMVYLVESYMGLKGGVARTYDLLALHYGSSGV